MGNIGLLVTIILTAATGWIAFSRFRMRLDNSWPLFYYLGLVMYLNAYDMVLNPYVVYVAVVCALLIRFEFMNERLVFFVRIIEVACLAHIGWRMLSAIFHELG